MRSLNILRAIVFAVAAGFLIFIQDHSISVGMNVLQFITAALAVGGVVLYKIEEFSKEKSILIVPSSIALGIALLTVGFGGFETSLENKVLLFRVLVATFAGSMAFAELVFARKENSGERLELRISSALGFLTVLVFAILPLDALNSVGMFSAYLSLSSVQRALWAAGPNDRKEKTNG